MLKHNSIAIQEHAARDSSIFVDVPGENQIAIATAQNSMHGNIIQRKVNRFDTSNDRPDPYVRNPFLKGVNCILGRVNHLGNNSVHAITLRLFSFLSNLQLNLDTKTKPARVFMTSGTSPVDVKF
jgi:hypothetical protein